MEEAKPLILLPKDSWLLSRSFMLHKRCCRADSWLAVGSFPSIGSSKSLGRDRRRGTTKIVSEEWLNCAPCRSRWLMASFQTGKAAHAHVAHALWPEVSNLRSICIFMLKWSWLAHSARFRFIFGQCEIVCGAGPVGCHLVLVPKLQLLIAFGHEERLRTNPKPGQTEGEREK